MQLHHSLGILFEVTVMQQLVSAAEQRQLAVLNGCYHNGVSAMTVVVDARWSKRSRRYSYSTKSGVG